MSRRPLPGTSTDLADKGIKQQFSARGMVDFRMELYTVKVAIEVLNSADRGVVGMSDLLKTIRYNFDMIAVAHPDRAVPVDEETIEQRPGSILGEKIRVSIFTLPCRNDLATEMMTHQLHAITDPQHRDTELKQRFFDRRSTLIIYRFRATREDDPFCVKRLDLIKAHIKRM